MTRPIHPNAIKSSNLLRLSALLILIGYYLFDDRVSLITMLGALISICVITIAAYLVRNGYNWVRWFLLITKMLDVIFFIPATFYKLNVSELNMYAITLIHLIQILAVVLLFIPYHIPEISEDFEQPIEFTED